MNDDTTDDQILEAAADAMVSRWHLEGLAAAAAIKRVYSHDHVSFAEIAKIVEQHELPTRGEVAMELEARPNVLLWAGMSEEFYTVAGAVYAHKHIEARPTSQLTYLCDGAMLKLPVAKSVPKQGYKRPRWLPTVFSWIGPRDRLAAAREGLGLPERSDA